MAVDLRGKLQQHSTTGESMSKSESGIAVKWFDEPQEHDYPAAESYLTLLKPAESVRNLLQLLQAAPVVSFKAKDIFRASGLSLLGVSNSHVEADRQKIKGGTCLSPLLLVRDTDHGRLIVADGYHRLCAVYSVDEDAVIPCKLA